MARVRVDKLLVERGLVESRERAQAVLMAGRVFVAGQRVDKPGTALDERVELELRGDPCPYVSRGGLKLAGVLEPLAVRPEGLLCADIGASTGGFTDVLLQHGAVRVHAVDVGHGQLHERLRADPRVRVYERVNARFDLAGVLPERVQLVVMDVSFISLTLVLPGVLPALAEGEGATVVAMVKPQFELSREEVRGGVVRDDGARLRAVERVVTAARALGLEERGRAESPLAGPKGNRELFVKLVRSPGA